MLRTSSGPPSQPTQSRANHANPAATTSGPRSARQRRRQVASPAATRPQPAASSSAVAQPEPPAYVVSSRCARRRVSAASPRQPQPAQRGLDDGATVIPGAQRELGQQRRASATAGSSRQGGRRRRRPGRPGRAARSRATDRRRRCRRRRRDPQPPSLRRASTADRGRPRVLRDVRQRLGAHEVGGRLDLGRKPLLRGSHRDRAGAADASSASAAASPRSVSVCGWIPRASSCSSTTALLELALQRPRATWRRPSVHTTAPGRAPRASSRVELCRVGAAARAGCAARRPLRRCSPRRRELATCARSSACRRALTADSRAAAATASARAGRPYERFVVDEHGDRLALPLDQRRDTTAAGRRERARLAAAST